MNRADLFQLHPVLEGFANAMGNEIVTVRVRVEGDGDGLHVDIHFAALSIGGDEQNEHRENGFGCLSSACECLQSLCRT